MISGGNAVVMEEERWEVVSKTMGLCDLRTHRKNHVVGNQDVVPGRSCSWQH